MFVNGAKQRVLNATAPGAISGTDVTTFLGNPGDTTSIQASMTDIVVVNTALSDAQITAYATAPFI
jgi:hypothetical protein